MHAWLVDFMSVMRKIPVTQYSSFADAFDHVWHLVTTAVRADQVDVVYGSHFESSIKETERRHRSPADAIEIANMKLSYPIPVGIERF